MAVREVVTLHLPLEMGAVGRILRAVAQVYPDAVVGEPSRPGTMAVHADDDASLTPAMRRKRVRDRDRQRAGRIDAGFVAEGQVAAAQATPGRLAPHPFRGRLDRPCEVPRCNLPDRHPVHARHPDDLSPYGPVAADEYVSCPVEGCDFAVERGEGQAMARHGLEHEP